MTVDLHSRDGAIVEGIMNRSDSRFEHTSVIEMVWDYVEQFDGALIKAFVPVLVTKMALDELWRLDPHGSDRFQRATTD